jgi:hypothetical protein
MVEERMVSGRPRHHLPDARKTEFSPDSSSIFVVDFADFDKMEGKDIQEVFRKRHILVLGDPGPTLKFDRAGLSTLGSMKKTICMQGWFHGRPSIYKH